MVPAAEVLYFEAADKYVHVLTANCKYMVSTLLKELAPQLPAQQFWQIHRGRLARAIAIASVERDAMDRLQLTLRNRPKRLVVSRL